MTEQGGPPPTEEELQAAYEAELKRVRIEEVLVQTVVSLVNLGGRKAGLVPGTEDERDLDQVRLAVEGTRAILPLVEGTLGPDAARVRDALAQLQMAYAQAGQADAAGRDGSVPAPPPPPSAAAPQAEAPPAPSRLWVPGQ